MVVKVCFCTLAALAAFVCAIGDAGWALEDKPIAAFKRELLDLAFETATAIPIRPHIKDRSKTQAAVVAASLELEQPQRALAYLQKIDNWRRGASYADLAFYSARHGKTKAAHHYLERAGQIARDPEVKDWRRDRIRVKIAKAYLWLGQTRQAEQFEAGVVASESGKVAQVKATRGNRHTFHEQIKALDALISQGSYDLTKNALEAYAALFDRFYGDAKRRSQVEGKIDTSIDKLPVWFRIRLLISLTQSAWAHTDRAKASELLKRAQSMAEAHQWPPRYGLPLQAQLAELRPQIGDPQQGRAEVDAALTWFDTVRHQMFDIDRAGALRPLAEAYQSMGDAAAALAVYRRAVEEGVVNPNSRPKAEDLSATCRSSEVALLNLRMESPQLMDSISSDLMSRAGAGDAAAALNLVAGATVQDGKFAVVRGLPDRYVSSQMNGVRLPTADADKRAVELDQFPSAVIESIQVSKTFTPDQQGDASGGAVNVRLKGIPDETVFELGAGVSFNTQVTGRDDFLTYDGGGVDVLGIDGGSRDIPSDGMFDGAVGVSRDDAPFNFDLSLTAGHKHRFDLGIEVGGFASLFYERDSAYFDGGIDDQLWVENPGDPLTPQKVQNQGEDDFKTSLFDVTQGRASVQWGGLGTVGVAIEDHALTLLYMYTRVAEDKATLAEDTRGKQFFFPGHDPDDPETPGHGGDLFAAPYLRTETLAYSERTTQTLQISGQHTLPIPEYSVKQVFKLLRPEVDWTVAMSAATLEEPDKRQFGSFWRPGIPERVFPFPGIPPIPPVPPTHFPFKPAANFTLGNLQRTFQTITEDSTQYFANLRMPFEQWSGNEGFVKLGVFNDRVKRDFDQESFSNFNNNDVTFEGEFEELFSEAFPTLPEAGVVTGGPPFVDVDYQGEQDLTAWYFMVDLPLTSFLSLIGGLRFEHTRISIINDPERDATWLPPGASGPVTLNPGDADVSFEQHDILPSIGFVLTPLNALTLRGSYTETVARQTFKELSPIQQQEFLGGDVFIGNPDLMMSALKNFDLRLDYTLYPGGLLSASWFYKDIKDPIEFVQQNAGFTFTRPVNFPKGKLSGFEFETRQDLGHFWDVLEGLSMQANATIIDAQVNLPEEEIERFASDALMVPRTTRDMVNAPAYLYSIGLTYDLERTGTQIASFYTVRGDTLVAGVGQSSGNFIPDVYARAVGTLNLSISQNIGAHWQLQFSAKNLTNPKIEEVYRSEFIDSDVTKTSFRKGVDFSISLSARR